MQEANPVTTRRYERSPTRSYCPTGRCCCSTSRKIEKDSTSARPTMASERASEKSFNSKSTVRMPTAVKLPKIVDDFSFFSTASPYFAAPSRMVNVKKGDTANLQCEVNGDKPINVVWLRGGKYELNPTTNYRVSIKQDATPEGISAEVQIMNVESSDSGQYFCQASNLYGRDQQLVQLIVQEPPQPPSALETAIVASRSVNLKWQPRGGDAAEVTKYIVEYREADRQWQYMEISDPPQYTAVIENLKPATKYSFRVIAEGPAGKSAPSQGERRFFFPKR